MLAQAPGLEQAFDGKCCDIAAGCADRLALGRAESSPVDDLVGQGIPIAAGPQVLDRLQKVPPIRPALPAPDQQLHSRGLELPMHGVQARIIDGYDLHVHDGFAEAGGHQRIPDNHQVPDTRQDRATARGPDIL